MELIHEALVNQVVITKRDMFYRDPALFSKQSVVDRFVDDIACTFGVPRLLLNVTATAKGLIAGAFTIRRSNGVETHGLSERDGTLISPLKHDDVVNVELVRWILVVEKEATFHSLVASSFWEYSLNHGILATGKGYPDISTRALLRLLATPSPRNGMALCPIYGLMDYDPDGIQILSTYRHGSIALAHENAELNLPSIRWLGVKSCDLVEGHESSHQIQGLLRLTARDRRKAMGMLGLDSFAEHGIDLELRREIQVMLMLNVKAEIQQLDSRSVGLQGWLKDAEIL